MYHTKERLCVLLLLVSLLLSVASQYPIQCTSVEELGMHYYHHCNTPSQPAISRVMVEILSYYTDFKDYVIIICINFSDLLTIPLQNLTLRDS